MPLDIKETFPLTHEQAVRLLLDAEWNGAERLALLNASISALQQGMGQAIQEYWGLGNRTWPLSLHYQRRFGLGHADDMSQLILANFKAALKDDSFCLDNEVNWLRKHWMDQGVDPLTLERFP